MKDYCKASSPEALEERGCAVCGSLTNINDCTSLDSEIRTKLQYLEKFAETCTRRERGKESDPILHVPGPVIDQDCTDICRTCLTSVKKNQLPRSALANGLWLGKVPNELQNLTWAEERLISKVRTNNFYIKVSKSGFKKIKNHVVSFENPTQAIYNTLPPSKEELDACIAVMFVGADKPSTKELNNTPFVVRRTKVQKALEWLKMNHCDYYDLDISQKNLNEYPEEGFPFTIHYVISQSDSNRAPEATSKHEVEADEGVSSGQSPIIIHGLLEKDVDTKPWKLLGSKALHHLREKDGKMMAVGHKETPESIFKNPKLYPQIFPWLFPYGLGGIDNENQTKHVSSKAHKKQLLMYHDKRFQKDRLFCLVAFNHEQIKDSTGAGFIMTKQSSFQKITQRILNLDMMCL